MLKLLNVNVIVKIIVTCITFIIVKNNDIYMIINKNLKTNTSDIFCTLIVSLLEAFTINISLNIEFIKKLPLQIKFSSELPENNMIIVI